MSTDKYKEFQEKILNTKKKIKGEKPRVSNVVKALNESGGRLPAVNIQNIVESEKISKVKVSDTDPRDRVRLTTLVDPNFSQMNVHVSNNSKKHVSWAVRMTGQSLERFYGTLAKLVGEENKTIRDRKDINIGVLLEKLQVQEIGLSFKIDKKSDPIRVDNATELAVFMNRILEDKNVSRIADKIHGTKATIDSLARYPEKRMLTSLFRVLDQVNVETTVYDRRLDNEHKAPGMGM